MLNIYIFSKIQKLIRILSYYNFCFIIILNRVKVLFVSGLKINKIIAINLHERPTVDQMLVLVAFEK